MKKGKERKGTIRRFRIYLKQKRFLFTLSSFLHGEKEKQLKCEWSNLSKTVIWIVFLYCLDLSTNILVLLRNRREERSKERDWKGKCIS